MKKQDYLNLLRYNLRDLPEVVVNDIVFDYDEHFRIGMESGKTEDQISDELGSPSVIAKEFIDSTTSRKKSVNFSENKYSMGFEENPKKKEIDWLKWFGIVALIILFAPLAISLIFGLFSLIAGIFVAIIGIAIALIGSAIALIGNLIVPGFTGLPGLGVIKGFYGLNILTQIAFTVFSISLGIVAIYGAIKFLKLVFKVIRDLIVSARWKLERRYEK